VIDQWPGGFKGDVTVTNTGGAINGWTVTWTFPTTAQRITQLWNGSFTQTGANVTVRNLSYNNLIPTGGSVNFGFLSNWSGTNPVPTVFTLNGLRCTNR
jgi:cellulase/cellobiase CelA1